MMDFFFIFNNCEIVKFVFGFVKVCIFSLFIEMMFFCLEIFFFNLMVWSYEYKGYFCVKVKYIIERMICWFGVDVVMRYCFEDDKKFIINICKIKECSKRRKDVVKNVEESDGEDDGRRKNRFESEYD